MPPTREKNKFYFIRVEFLKLPLALLNAENVKKNTHYLHYYLNQTWVIKSGSHSELLIRIPKDPNLWPDPDQVLLD